MKILRDTLRTVNASKQVDSPVYTYLKNLLPPSADSARALGEPEHSGEAAKTATASTAESPTLAVLIQEGEKAIAKDQFASAKNHDERRPASWTI